MLSIIIVIILLNVVSFIAEKIDDAQYKNKVREQSKIEFSEIEYNIPNEFEDSNFIYSQRYTYDNNEVSCYIDITSYRKYSFDNLISFFKHYIQVSLEDEVGELNEYEINNKKACNIDVKNRNGNIGYYGFESTNYYYLLSYEIRDDLYGDRNEENICYSAKDTIINSIKTK